MLVLHLNHVCLKGLKICSQHVPIPFESCWPEGLKVSSQHVSFVLESCCLEGFKVAPKHDSIAFGSRRPEGSRSASNVFYLHSNHVGLMV